MSTVPPKTIIQKSENFPREVRLRSRLMQNAASGNTTPSRFSTRKDETMSELPCINPAFSQAPSNKDLYAQSLGSPSPTQYCALPQCAPEDESHECHEREPRAPQWATFPDEARKTRRQGKRSRVMQPLDSWSLAPRAEPTHLECAAQSQRFDARVDRAHEATERVRDVTELHRNARARLVWEARQDLGEKCASGQKYPNFPREESQTKTHFAISNLASMTLHTKRACK